MRTKWELRRCLGTPRARKPKLVAAAAALRYRFNSGRHPPIVSGAPLSDSLNAARALIPPLATVRSWEKKQTFPNSHENPCWGGTQLLMGFFSGYSTWCDEKPKVPLRRATTRPRLHLPRELCKKKKRKRCQENCACCRFINHPGCKREGFSLPRHSVTIWRLMERDNATQSIRGPEKAVVKISSRRSERLIYGTVNCGRAVCRKHRRRNF